MTTDKKKDLLKRLTEVEGFEKFIHRTFVGQKRFSIEGLDTLVPMLDESIDLSMSKGTKNVMIGMAHRGRLNVLAHTLESLTIEFSLSFCKRQRKIQLLQKAEKNTMMVGQVM